jgi:crossover junction endodeoxyribonuclease RusA
MNEITFGWPPKELSPNARVHWARRARAAKAYKEACWARTLQSGVKIGFDGLVHLWITFYPPDRRHRDDDNMIASFKNGRDGMALALGIDDKRFRIHPQVSDQIGGMVKVRFSADLDR